MTKPNLDDVNYEDLRRDATDEELKAILRHPQCWSYAVRNFAGDVVTWGRGKTRAECEREAAKSAGDFASELCWDENPRARALMREARFLIWPPA